MKNWCGKKKMNSSSEEELKIPVLGNVYGPTKRSVGVLCMDFVGTAILIAFLAAIGIWIVYPIITEKKHFTSYKPEIRLDSLIFCTTNTTSKSNNNLVIWDLKLDITNTNNYSDLCIDPFEVSIFSSYHQNNNKLLTKKALTQTCLDPINQTSASVLADASLLDPNDDLHLTNGTMIFDLKIHGHFWFSYIPFRADYGGDVVCGDVKVALSASSNSSCASMVDCSLDLTGEREKKKGKKKRGIIKEG